MLGKIHGCKNKVVGIKQTCKAIKQNKAKLVYIAKDVDRHLFEEVKKLCEENHVEIYYVKTMKELGEVCAIDIKAASAALISDN